MRRQEKGCTWSLSGCSDNGFFSVEVRRAWPNGHCCMMTARETSSQMCKSSLRWEGMFGHRSSSRLLPRFHVSGEALSLPQLAPCQYPAICLSSDFSKSHLARDLTFLYFPVMSVYVTRRRRTKRVKCEDAFCGGPYFGHAHKIMFHFPMYRFKCATGKRLSGEQAFQSSEIDLNIEN